VRGHIFGCIRAAPLAPRAHVKADLGSISAGSCSSICGRLASRTCRGLPDGRSRSMYLVLQTKHIPYPPTAGASSSSDASTTTNSCRSLDMDSTTAHQDGSFLDLSKLPTLAEVTAEYNAMSHGPVLDGQTSESHPYGRPGPFCEGSLNFWCRSKLQDRAGAR
jgi:hypothetical protein